MKWLIPPVLVLLCLALMTALDKWAPITPIFANKATTLLGLALIFLGVSITLIIVYTFIKVETNLHVFKDPDKLVTTGLFALTRNPIYLGFVMILIGAAILFNSYSTLIGPLIFFLVANFWYIPYEEQAAFNQFGQAYTDYRKKVRRWI